MENVTTLEGQFLHELIFETEEQAGQAARHLSNVERTEITNATDDISYFVDVASAWRLRFFTTYELPERVQDLLKNCTGLIPEILPDFNLDAEQERQIEESMDKVVAAIESGGLVAIVMKRHSQETHRDLQPLLNEPTWKKICTRIAVILLVLLMFPLNVMHGLVELFFPGLMVISSIICLTVLAVALTLIVIAHFKDFRCVEQDERGC